MPIPSIVLKSLGPPMPLASPPLPPSTRIASVRSGIGAMPALSWDLNLVMESQPLGSNWCWAATSASVAAYYSKASAWTQCAVVDAELGQTTCCADWRTSQCDQAWYLDRALTRVKHFASMQAAPVTVLELQAELAAKRPVGIRVAWRGGGAHFLVVDGLDLTAGGLVTAKDPAFGTTTAMPFATFQTAYQSTGVWTHIYFTRP